MPILAMQPKPKSKTIIIPVLAEFTHMGDGTYKFKPMPMETDFDTWIGARMAATVIGVDQSTVYNLLKAPFLVFRRPAKKLYLISYRSALEYRAISAGPDFWEKQSLQISYAAQIQKRIDALKQILIPNDIDLETASKLILQR